MDEKLACEREVGNRSDTFAVAMKKDYITVGRVPRAILPICSIFIEVRQSSAGLLELDIFFRLTTRWTGIAMYSDFLNTAVQDPRKVSKTERHINDSIQLMKEKLVVELESTEKADNSGISNPINCSTSKVGCCCGGGGGGGSSSSNSGSKDEAIITVINLEAAEDEPPKMKRSRYIGTHLIIMGEKLTDRNQFWSKNAKATVSKIKRVKVNLAAR